MKVFFVNSTINQLVLARELIHDLSLDPRQCVVVLRKANRWTTRRLIISNEGQVREFGEWHKVYLVPQLMGRNFLAHIFDFINYAARARDILAQHKPDMLVMGNYLNEPMRHIASHFIKSGSVIFLDEGLSTIQIVEGRRDFFRTGKERVTGFFSSIIKNRLLGLRTGHVNRQVTFYTLLDLSSDPMTAIRLCRYNKLRATLQPAEIDDAVYFLGGPFAERGYLTREDSSRLFRKVLDSFVGIPLVYFPHPNEDLEAVRMWAADQTFEVRVADRPFELYMYERPVRPRHVASYNSTGVACCIHLFKEQLNYHYFEMPNHLLRKASENVALIYSFMRQHYSGNPNVSFHDWSGNFPEGKFTSTQDLA